MIAILARLLHDRSGATAIEYGLIGALISVAVVSGATALGNAVDTKFTVASDAMNAAGN